MNIHNKSGASRFWYFILNKRLFLTMSGMLLNFASAIAAPPDVPLKTGLVIRSSTGIKPGVYKLAPVDQTKEIITIEGDNITVDFKGAVLQGHLKPVAPDHYVGIGIRLKGNNITVKNAVIKGYKVGLIAADCEHIQITACDLSYNYKPHLSSTPDKDDPTGWLRYQTNEKDEWLLHGAGIYLKNCARPQVDNCTVTGGQNGLLLMGCNDGKIWNNTFSFLSGIGIGMYRSSHNQVMHNRLDWCVRSHSRFAGQKGNGSAGILVFEQSAENTFAYNSATHCGNGFMLWASNQTMETGEGGCNDNLLYGNDFSYAVFSGIEMTSSHNRILKNRIAGCLYGIWGSYVHHSLILSNQFMTNKVAIAIENGQENSVTFNAFDKDTTGIQLQRNNTPDKNWPNLQAPNSESQEYIIANNTFNKSITPLELSATKNILIENNSFSQFTILAKTDSDVNGIELIENNLNDYEPAQVQSLSIAGILSNGKNYFSIPVKKFTSAPAAFTDSTGIELLTTILEDEAPESPEGAINAMLPAKHLQGSNYLLTDAWGPYDFKSPLLSLRSNTGQETCEFELLGPSGKWKVKKLKGVTLSAGSGNIPGSVTAKFTNESLMGVEIELEYIGASVTTPSGEKTEAGKPYLFYFKQAGLPISRSVK